MTFRLNHAVMHELRKERHTLEAKAFLADRLLDMGGLVEELALSVEGFISDRGHRAVHLRFDPDRYSALPMGLHRYCTGSRSGEEFLELTRECTASLLERFRKELMAVGGYLLYTDSESGGDRFVTVAMFRQKCGLSISGLVPAGKSGSDSGRIRQLARVSFESLSRGHTMLDEDNLMLIGTRLGSIPTRYFIEGLCGIHVRKPMSPNIARVFQTARGMFERDRSIPFGFRGVEPELKKLMRSRIKRSVTLDEIIDVLSPFLPEDERDRLADELRREMKGQAVPDSFHVSMGDYDRHVYFMIDIDGMRIKVEKSEVGFSEDEMIYLDEAEGKLILSDPSLIRKLHEAILEDRVW